MSDHIETDRVVVAPHGVVAEPPASSVLLRVFQIVSALAGAALFVLGLVAIFDVDFGADLTDSTAAVSGYGFSAVAAIAALLAGGAILAATLADEDRSSAALAGLVTIALGIAGFVIDGQTDPSVQVDRRSAGLFVAVGAIVFVCSLVPWWGRRRVVHDLR